MPKSREIQRGEGFESSTVHKPNAALEAFEELVKAVKEGRELPDKIAQAFLLQGIAKAGDRQTLETIRRLTGSAMFKCTKALTRAGEIRKALTERKGD